MLTDATGRPLRFIVTAGQVNDCTQAARLLENVETGHVIADKGYDSEGVLQKIEELGAIAPSFHRSPIAKCKGSTTESCTKSAT